MGVENKIHPATDIQSFSDHSINSERALDAKIDANSENDLKSENRIATPPTSTDLPISDVDHRPLVLKDAIFQDDLHSAPYALSVSSPKIEPIDKRLLVANAHESMQHQADQQIKMLRKQAELLINQAKSIEDRLELSHAIYKADINFEPIIHGIYHLYQREDGRQVLSMVAPYEWGKSMPYSMYLNTVRLLADRTWEILA